VAAGASRVAVLISGRGTNLKALIDHQEGYEICLVLSNRPNALGLEIARNHQIPARVIDHTKFGSRSEFELAMLSILSDYSPEWIVLAGFLRILTGTFISQYVGRIVNIHPSLLPEFPGMHPNRQALKAKARFHGVTVHFVTPELDAGPTIAQSRLEILDGEGLESLKERTLRLEHRLLPEVVSRVARREIVLAQDRVLMKGEPLPENGFLLN